MLQPPMHIPTLNFAGASPRKLAILLLGLCCLTSARGRLEALKASVDVLYRKALR